MENFIFCAVFVTGNNHRSRQRVIFPSCKARRFRNTILSEISEINYEHSKSISAPLPSVMIMERSQMPDSKVINEIKYSKKKDSNVLLKEKILPSIRNLTLRQRKLLTMQGNLVHYLGLMSFHLCSMVSP